MGFLENAWVLHPDGTQFVNIEKTPVVDLLGSNLPVGESINLLLEQIIQEVKASRVLWIAIKYF